MKNVRKLLALMLAFVLCTGMFAGCTESDDQYTGPAPSLNLPNIDDSIAGKTNAERYPLESSKTYTIANRTANPDERDTFQLWNKATGVDVEWIELYGDQLSTAMVGGDMPDAICISYGVSKDIVYEFGKAGKLVNFADYLGYMPNFQKMLAKYPAALTNYLNEDGSFYSLPSQSSGFGTPSNLLYVREDMLEESGLTLPTTVDEFKKFILDLQDFYSDVEGFTALNFLMGGEWGYIEWNGYMDNYFFPAFGNEALQTGYDLVGDKVVLGCATEQYKRYLKFIAEIYASGACEQDIFSPDCTNANLAKTAANQVAVFPSSSLGPSNFKDGIVRTTTIAPLTSQWQDKQIWTNETAPGWHLSCINGLLPEEDIITLVQWFDAFYATDEDPLNEEGTLTGACLYLGEENVHFKINDNDTYERIYSGNYKTINEWTNNEVCNTSLYLTWFRNIAYANSTFYCKQVAVRDKMWPYMVERWNKETLFLNEDESFEASDVNIELNIYMESAFAKFMTGKWTVEKNWDEYMNGLESIGALDLVDVYQAAYDRYK